MKHLFFATSIWISLALPLAAQDIPLSKILVEKEGWREVATESPNITYLEALSTGDIDMYEWSVRFRLGRVPKEKRLKLMGVNKGQTIASTDSNHYVIRKKDKLSTGTVGIVRDWMSEVHGYLNLPGLTAPTCLTLWPDEGHLVIGEADGAYLWAVRIEKDGSFGPGDRYYSLRTRPNEKMHVTAMTMDAGYLLYACTPLGIQVFDPTGRLSGVIASPAKETMTAITIGGATADNLYVAAGERIYARKIQGKAIYTLKKDN